MELIQIITWAPNMKILTKVQPKISRKTSGPWTFAGWLGSGAGGTPPIAAGPDPFVIPAKVDQEPSTSITSVIVTPTGQGNVDAPITVTGGRYQINGTGGFVSTPGVFNAGDYFEAQVDSASGYEVGASCTIQINDVSAAFTVTTRAQDTTPDAFSFVDQTDVEPNTMITSAPVTIQGMDDNCPVSIVDGEYDVNASGSWSTLPGTIDSGDAVRVRRLSSTGADMTVDVVFTAGTVSDTFSSTTVATISLDTGHALGDTVTSLVLVESPTTMEGVNILDLANNFNFVLSQSGAGGYIKEPGGGVTFDKDFEGKAQTLAPLPITGFPFTLVLQVKIPDPMSQIRGIVFAQSTSSTNVLNIGITDEPDEGGININSDIRFASDAWVSERGTTPLVVGSIHTICMVYTSSTERKFFLDGALESSNVTGIVAGFPALADNICLSALCRNPPAYADGTIYAVHMYDRALSNAEAEAITADIYQNISGYSGP